MYNRYLRHDQNDYVCLADEDIPPPPKPERPSLASLRKILEKLHINRIDSGDLFLLLLLIALYEAKADEETLIALGLLLIL